MVASRRDTAEGTGYLSTRQGLRGAVDSATPLAESLEKSEQGQIHLAVSDRWRELGFPDPAIEMEALDPEEYLRVFQEFLDSYSLSQQNAEVHTSATGGAASTRVEG